MMEDIKDRLIDFFRGHSRAYKSVFSVDKYGTQYVLGDLQEFCHVMDTTMRTNDPLELARNEGRRQVYLRIQRALNLSPEQQFAIAEAAAQMKRAMNHAG